MRLNRVLLLAATINIMIFALLFTISCSGDDGKDGKAGANCTAEPNGEGGFNVICGGENIGILEGPADHKGKDGPDGSNGTDGLPGSYCVLGSQTSAGIQINCNGSLFGTLDACDANNVTTVYTVITCGKSTVINVCNGAIFDAKVEYCTVSGDLDAIENDKGVCQDGSKYTKSTQYCGYKAKTSTKRTALPKCNIQEDAELWNGAPSNQHPNQGTYYDASEDGYQTVARCLAANGDPVYSDQSSVGYNNVSYPYDGYNGCVINDWQNQYCQWTDETVEFYGNFDTRNNPRTVDDSWNDPEMEVFVARCAGKTLNEGSWKGQYCGYIDAPKSGQIRSVQTGLCDDFKYNTDKGFGPNEIASGYAYCAVPYENRYSKKTVYTDKTASGDQTAMICKNDKRPNNGKWLGEYCGYSAPYTKSSGCGDGGGAGTAADPCQPVADSISYKDICDDGNGPQAQSYSKNNYCRVYPSGIAYFGDRDSTEFSQGDCEGADRNGNPTYKTPNKGKWLGQYCGYAKSSETADRLLSNICDDFNGPNQDGYNPAEYCQSKRNEDGNFKTFLAGEMDVCQNGEKINENTWKGEYCGYADEASEETSRLTGACGDDKGPNSEKFGGGYCAAPSKTELVVYTTNFCGEDGKPNEGSWKGEYCGYESATSQVADKVYSGACDDGSGPNQGGFNAGYCRWTEEKSTGTELADEYCGGATLNEGSWKGEYCYSDEKVAVCTGGRIPNTDKKSTDPFTVRCFLPATDLQCSDTNLRACDADGCADLGDGFAWDADAFECRVATAED